MNPGGDRAFAGGRGGPGGFESSRLQLTPNEQEMMDLKQRITANLEEARRSVGSVQLQYIELVQKDITRAHELLHALIVTECKNKVNIYKRQLNRLYNALDDILGRDTSAEPPPTVGILQHTADSMYCCRFSPDGTKAASGCGDGLIRISDVMSGNILHVLDGHKDDVFSVRFSPDGTKIASASKDKTVRIWDVATGSCLFTLTGHTLSVLGAAFVDDVTVVSASQDATVRVWDTNTGKCTMVLQPEGAPLLACAASPDRKLVATCSSEGNICLIDIRKGMLLHTIRGHKKAIWSVNFSPNGKMLCSCGEDSVVRVWDAESGTLIRTFGEGALCSYLCVFSSNSKLVASASVDKTVRIWNLDNGAMRTITGHSKWVFHCAFSPDDRLIMTASEDHTVRLWRLDTGEPCTPEMLSQAKSGFNRQEGSSKNKNRDNRENRDSRAQRMSNSVQALYNDIRVNTCPEHGIPLGFYCVEERKFLCDECVKTHDEEHHITDGLGLAKMSERALQDIVMTFLTSANGTDETLEAHMNLLMESRIAARRKVEMTMNTLLEAVAERRKQLLKQVDLAYDQALFSLRTQHSNYHRELLTQLNTFGAEVTAGMLCDTYLNADKRFTSPMPPLVLQPVQVCYFGNTSSQNIAADISRMGNVAINTAPPAGFQTNGAQSAPIQKPYPQMAQPAQPQHKREKPSQAAPVITMAAPATSTVTVPFSTIPITKQTVTSNQDTKSPLNRCASEPLQPDSPDPDHLQPDVTIFTTR